MSQNDRVCFEKVAKTPEKESGLSEKGTHQIQKLGERGILVKMSDYDSKLTSYICSKINQIFKKKERDE